MTLDELKASLRSAIDDAEDIAKLTKYREDAQDYFDGEPFGDELPGKSKVVDRLVAEAIWAQMPGLMRIFASGEHVVEFAPREESDVDAAQQATEYISYIWSVKNPGYRNFHDWFFDAMKDRIGVAKAWWEELESSVPEPYFNATQEEIDLILSDPDIMEIESQEPHEDPSFQNDEFIELEQTFDVVFRRKEVGGSVRVAILPSEEFLIEKGAPNIEDAGFSAHRRKMTISKLIDMGFPKEIVENLPTDNADQTNEEANRFQKESTLKDDVIPADNTMREVWVTESYFRVDFDGDGVAELRKIISAGNEETILENEESDGLPWGIITPYPIAHKVHGQSIADQTMDLQRISSVLWRQMLDNLYLTNNPQKVVIPSQIETFDDLLTSKTGGIIRAKTQEAVREIKTEFVAGESFPMLEWITQKMETRTGVTRNSQGLDADTLNKTARGIELIQNAGLQRPELVARNFAETGVKQIFKRILELVSKYQNKPDIIRLRGRLVKIDPSQWKNGFDLVINTAIGAGSKDAQVQNLLAQFQLDQGIVEQQGGIEGPFVNAQNISHKLKKWVELSGFKDSDNFYMNPEDFQPPEEQPDPEVLEIQAKQQKDQAELQLKKEKQDGELALKAKQLEQELALKREQLAAELQLKQQQLQAEIALAQVSAGTAAGVKLAETGIKSQVGIGGEPG